MIKDTINNDDESNNNYYQISSYYYSFHSSSTTFLRLIKATLLLSASVILFHVILWSSETMQITKIVVGVDRTNATKNSVYSETNLSDYSSDFVKSLLVSSNNIMISSKMTSHHYNNNDTINRTNDDDIDNSMKQQVVFNKTDVVVQFIHNEMTHNVLNITNIIDVNDQNVVSNRTTDSDKNVTKFVYKETNQTGFSDSENPLVLTNTITNHHSNNDTLNITNDVENSRKQHVINETDVVDQSVAHSEMTNNVLNKTNINLNDHDDVSSNNRADNGINATNLVYDKTNQSSYSNSKNSSILSNTHDNNNNDTIIPKNLHIVFVGDSVTRYQYLNLIYYLYNGQWINDNDQPNLAYIKQYKSWIQFYNCSNEIFHGNEKCDCYRGSKSKLTFESRYYSDPIHNNYISFLFKLGKINAQGHWNASIAFSTDPNIASLMENKNPIVSNTQSITKGQEKQQKKKNKKKQKQNVYLLSGIHTKIIKPLWNYNWIDMIQYYIKDLQPRPQYMVLNAGLWENNFHNITLLYDIQKVCQLYNITSIYKTTTARRIENISDVINIYQYEQHACHIFDICYNLSWTGNIMEDKYYHDHTHFIASINNKFNQQLLDIIYHHKSI